MSTEIAKIQDRLDSEIELEIYVGSAGICLFPRRTSKEGFKFWIHPDNVEDLIDALRTAVSVSKGLV